LIIRQPIAGKLLMRVSPDDSKTRIWLEKYNSHLMNVCEIHQNVATFNWYSPRWTGKIAESTSYKESRLKIHGDHTITMVPITLAPIRRTCPMNQGNLL
jgi:hypothetical protein